MPVLPSPLCACPSAPAWSISVRRVGAARVFSAVYQHHRSESEVQQGVTDQVIETRQPGTPWAITRRKSGIGSVIPDKLIEEHYRELLER